MFLWNSFDMLSFFIVMQTMNNTCSIYVRHIPLFSTTTPKHWHNNDEITSQKKNYNLWSKNLMDESERNHLVLSSIPAKHNSEIAIRPMTRKINFLIIK